MIKKLRVSHAHRRTTSSSCASAPPWLGPAPVHCRPAAAPPSPTLHSQAELQTTPAGRHGLLMALAESLRFYLVAPVRYFIVDHRCSSSSALLLSPTPSDELTARHARTGPSPLPRRSPVSDVVLAGTADDAGHGLLMALAESLRQVVDL